jgi:site-specific DNA-cytosine methylase
MRVLVACEFSGIVREAFKAKGHDAWSCDLLPTEIPGQHIQGDVLEILNDGWDMMIAHPPCTYLSYAGVAHWNKEGRCKQRLDALNFFRQLWEAPINKICIENPKGCASPTIAKYSQEIQPFYFDDHHIKTTWLWLKNLPLLVHTKEDTLFDSKTHTDRPEPLTTQIRKPSKNFKGGEIKKRYFAEEFSRNQKVRSQTFVGIANAMADQWG